MSTTTSHTEPWLEQVFGSFMAARLDMRLFGDANTFHPDTATLPALATYVHEHMHYFQTLFTGYGHIQWSSHRQSSGFLVRKWGELATMGFGYRVPLAAYSDDPRAAGFAEWLQLTSREQALLSAARFYMPVPNWSFKELGIRLIKEDWSINPVVSVGGQHVCLQGKDVLEGHAHFVERTYVERFLRPPASAWARIGLPDQYTRALDYFFERCGAVRHDEFPAVCDLALQTSWDPVIPRSEDDWRRSSPSWRFVQITDLLAANPWLSFGQPSEWPRTYAAVALKLFEPLGYRQLDDVIKERLAAFDRVPELMQVEQVLKSALEFRAERPWIVANPAAHLPWLEELFAKFRAPFVVIEGGIGNFGHTSVSGSELLFEMHYQALATQLLGNISSDAAGNGELRCAFGQFNIPRGCPYQDSHGCTGRLIPGNGAPVPTRIEANQDVTGCTFAVFLDLTSHDLRSIQVMPNARFPSRAIG